MGHPSIESGIYSLADLQKHYERMTQGRGHWFDEGTMRFFKSRLSEPLVYHGKRVLFFSSELGPGQPLRRYSIREYDTESGRIETIGLGFQGYKTLAAAKRAAQYLSKGEDNGKRAK